MNSTNIWKKRPNDKSEKKSNGILNSHNFKPKKKKLNLNLLKDNLITNWIENENDEKSQSSIDFDLLYKKSQINLNDQDEDSLQLENLQRLSTMKNIIFLDLENFSRFFQHLTNQLPDYTYVIAFQASNIQWKPPKNDIIYENLLNLNNFQLMRPSGNRHDAADFALVLTFGKLHGLLPKSISFTIISGDKGFIEVIHQLKNSHRRINWFNPHQFSYENFNHILNISSTSFFHL
ncbi:unnamed protein product [Rotaria sordida]|uniref:ZNF451 PIN-like domain-containing protein n=1 Tax=Rotaria sordida TaxID=392033 RepID=A0A819LKJ7_9BILA|nr:unnamed protein product [Rotaria sordida]CAF0935415.1 unnamed protein product [Rotaria sordida]CAF3962556.1 unnamed protein product [Rotaria sordida]